MNPSKFFIYRPVFTTMLILMVLLIGAVSLTRLPIDLVPDVTFPTLSISSNYSGAGPEEIEELITRPIEEAVSSAPGVEEITSQSREGSTRVRVAFDYGVDLSEASNDLRERIDRVINRLPEDADRPRLFKFDLTSFPIVILGVESDLDPIQTRQLIDSDIKNRIERIPGVASLDALGGLSKEIHIALNFDKVIALGIPFQQIIRHVQQANAQVPAGTIERTNQQILVRTPGQFKSLKDIEDTIVAVKNGVPIALKEIARVKDTHQKITNGIRVNEKPGIRLAIRKQSGTNTVEVADKIVKEINKLNRELRQMQLPILVDTSDFIKRSLQNVAFAILIGGILSIFILYFFLRNLSTTLVIATAIPISIIATFILMFFAGYTVNVITLGGLALGVGMLVDNAIVVLENIYRNREEGKEPVVAATLGSKQVATAIIASTLTTLAIFLPLAFVRGISGVTYQRLGAVVSFALICSLVVALSLVPMLTALILKWRKNQHLTIKAESPLLLFLNQTYKELLSAALKWRTIIIPSIFALLAASFLLVPLIGVEFMPRADEGEVRISGEMKPGITLDVLEAQFKKIEAIIRKEVPEATYILTELGATGYGGSNVSNKGQVRVYLVPKTERKRSSRQVANALRRSLKHIPGMVIRTRPASAFFVFRLLSGGFGNDRIQVDIRGFDIPQANKLAQEVRQVIQGVAGVTDTRLSQDEGSPEMGIQVDRLKAAKLGLSVNEIGEALQVIISGKLANTYREAGKEYNIRVKVEEADDMSLDKILNLPIITSTGRSIILKNIVKPISRKSPLAISRKDQERVITVSAEAEGRPINQVLDDIQTEIDQISLPKGFSVYITGDVEERQKSFRDMLMGLILALLLVYMIMASQYESFLYPFVVMFSVPLSAIGVILTLFLTNTTFNLQSFIGCIMLGGIVVNNAIILVDQINQLRQQEGFSLIQAVEEGGFRRLRPILMTTLTTILGLLPLALGIGEGSETQAPMARTVIGGLISSTLLTLFVIPLLYYTFERWRMKFKKADLEGVSNV